MLNSQLCKVRVGEVEIYAEAVPVPGSEPTSKAEDAGQRALQALGRAQDVILEMAYATAHTIGEAARRGTRPDQAEVEFGLKISVKGDVILAGAAGEASLRVKLRYEAPKE
jgi:hypothetical protein